MMKTFVQCGIIGLSAILPGMVSATTISYNLESLGGNHWQYSYTVINDSLSSAIEEFTIFFDPATYANLVVVASPEDWDLLVVEPDPAIPDDGYLDALTLATGIAPGASVGDFSVRFDWLSISGAPASQYFETVIPLTFEVVSLGETTFNPDSGGTTPVPEPTTSMLLGTGLLCLIGYSRRSMGMKRP